MYAFHPEARKEFVQAIDHYEGQEAGLGFDFTIEVHASVERVTAHPETWPFVYEEIRRCLVRRFPYGILYHHDSRAEWLLIIAVMHLHRDPDYWKHRTA